MEEKWSELGKKHNVTPAQQHKLFLLSVSPWLPPSQISELRCWHSSTVTRLLKPLKEKGFVCITPDQNQRKYKIVSITETGEHIFRELVKGLSKKSLNN